MYFPDALLAVSQHSKRGNDKHNPGQPLHWAKDKSADQADCIARHLIDIGPDWNALDSETGSYHATALAWRALALLQTVLDKEKVGKGALSNTLNVSLGVPPMSIISSDKSGVVLVSSGPVSGEVTTIMGQRYVTPITHTGGTQTWEGLTSNSLSATVKT